MGTFLEELTWRGLIYQKTPGIEKEFSKPTTIYYGIDPTAESLQFGNLLGISLLKRALEAGHHVIVLAGGGTAMIGDPGGKDQERPILPKETIDKNKEKMKQQLASFFNTEKVTMVDNADWLEKVTLIDFLRDAGKFISINTMLDKESVSARITREHGMSYAEFSYQLLQAYDYLELFKTKDCRVQVGGSDQWGNIVQGVELVRKKLGEEVHALSWPLIIDPQTGRKFGKSEGGKTIWLDPEKTHPFEFYQFIVNVPDDMAPLLAKYFSFKSKEALAELETQWAQAKETRLLQKELAFELTAMVHGTETAEKARKVAKILFDKGEEKMTEADVRFVQTALPHMQIQSYNDFITEDALVQLELAASKGEARRLVQQNGVKVENIDNRYLLIRKGKKEYGIVEIKPE